MNFAVRTVYRQSMPVKDQPGRTRDQITQRTIINCANKQDARALAAAINTYAIDGRTADPGIVVPQDKGNAFIDLSVLEMLVSDFMERA